MIFHAPLAFSVALRTLDAMQILPTTMSSEEIRGLDADLRARSIFSARTSKASYLQTVKDTIADLLEPGRASERGEGQVNMATARAQLQDMLDRLGYTPEGGFGDAAVPPAQKGSLRDLSSDKRLALMLETNVRQVANFAYQKSGQSDFALYAYPALELVRIYPRAIPRGLRRGRAGAIVPDPDNAWQRRWVRAGGELYAGRMIARKDAPVWEHLGDSQQFDDGLDTNYPPFAFNSGMGVREIPRDEAIALGVIKADTDIQGSSRSMNEGVQAAAKLDPDFLSALASDLDVAIADGKAKLKNREAVKPQRRRDAEVKRLRNRLAGLVQTFDTALAGKAVQA